MTAAAVLSIAIGIGANTAIFSVASALLLRPLPYQDADRLAILWNRSPGLNITEDWFSTAQYFDIKTGHTGFEDLAIAIGANYNLTGDGEPERIGTLRVSSNLLPMLGAAPALGRLFEPAEDVPGRSGTAILSHGTWARRYGRDQKVVGRSLTLNGQPYEIVGVLPEGFALPREVLPTLGVAEDGEIYLPLPLAANAATIRTREDYNILGKLKRGVSVAAAQAEMETITARLRRDFSGRVSAQRRPHVQHRAAARAGRGRRAAAARRAGRRGRLRAAHRVRERRQSAAVARARAPEGDRRARVARRQPRTAAPAAPDREPAARVRRRCPRAC